MRALNFSAIDLAELEALREKVVLSDCHLPDITPDDLIPKIRSIAPSLRILSFNHLQEKQVYLKTSHQNHYSVSKPETTDQFTALINRYLRP